MCNLWKLTTEHLQASSLQRAGSPACCVAVHFTIHAALFVLPVLGG